MMNPFLSSLEITVINKKTIKVETTKINENTVEIENTTTSTKPIETQSFTKSYHYPRQLGFIKELSVAGCRMLLYIQMKLKSEHDYIELKRTTVAKDLGISENSASLGIYNLVDNGVLAKKSQSEWWINPFILFNGNRLKYVKENNPKAIKAVDDYNPTIIRLGEVDLTSIVV